jgi:hypothetical protein
MRYISLWQQLSRDELPTVRDLTAVLEDPKQFASRVNRVSLWGAFSSSRPHRDVIYSYLAWGLPWLVHPAAAGLPPASDRGQVFAWYWSYWGRAALYMWLATDEGRFKTLFVGAMREVMTLRDDLHGKQCEIQDRVVKSWGALFPIGGTERRVTDSTATGLIALPILLFANTLRKDDPLYEEAAGYVCALSESMWEFDRFYVRLSDQNAGYYRWIGDPTLPDAVSHTNALAAAMVEIYRFTGEKRMLERVEELWAFFRLCITSDSDAVPTWAYMPGPPDFGHNRPAEFFWKSAVAIELPLAMWRARLVSEKEMQGFARLFSVATFANRHSLSLNARDRSVSSTLDLSRPNSQSMKDYGAFTNFIVSALELNEFDAVLNLKVAGYLADYPAAFRDGLFSDARIGVLGRAMSYYKDLSI